MTRIDLTSLVESIEAAALLVREEGEIVQANDSARDLLGLPDARAVEGQAFFDLLQPRDLFGNRLASGPFPYFDLLGQGEVPNPFELYCRVAGGSLQRVSANAVLVLAPEGESHVIFVMRPVLRRRRADEAIDRILRMPSLKGRILDRLPGEEDEGSFELTDRQRQVLRLIAEGLPNSTIARRLGVSEHTVRSHLQRIFRRLGVHSRSEAVAKAFRLALF